MPESKSFSKGKGRPTSGRSEERGSGGKRKPGSKRSAVKEPRVLSTESSSEDLRRDVSTVLVTGAAGPIGGFLVQHLLKAGFAVVAADHPGSDLPVPKAKLPVVVKPGDLSQPSFVRSCLEGVDAVLHAAAAVDNRRPYGILAPMNVEAPGMLVREARRRGVKRFIHFSSGLVYRRGSGPIAEDAALEAENDYEQTLLDAERIFLADRAPGLPLVTVLRVAATYGPRNRALMSSLATLPPLVKTLGPYHIPLSGGPRMSLVHGEDAARAALFLLFHPAAYGEVFNVAGRDPLSFAECINLAMESYGLKQLDVRKPYPPSTLLGSILPYRDQEDIFDPLNKVGSTLWERMVRKLSLKKVLTPRIDQEILMFGKRDLVLDNHKLLALGFRYKYPGFSKGWERTLAWYLKNRWIPGPKEV